VRLHLLPILSSYILVQPKTSWAIIAKLLNPIAIRCVCSNFYFAVFPGRAIFDLGMNLSLAAKRMTPSTSSIISTTTKSITANGEARN
jgi:hypothetical protein